MRAYVSVALLSVAFQSAALAWGGEPGGPGGDSFLEEVRGEGLLLADERNERIIQSQITKAEVEESIRLARSQMRENPQTVLDALKIQLERVDNVAGLQPDVRSQLRGQLEGVLREAAQRKIAGDAERQLALARQVAAIERTRRTDAIDRTQDKLQQIMDRFGSLMREGRYREAEELASVQAMALAENDPALRAAEQDAREKSYYERAMAIRDASHRNYVDAMYQVERAHVPFADDPPITYPDPQVWQELTVRRKRYSSVALDRRGKSEEKILAALDDNTRLEFIDTPLSEVIDYLKDLHNIPIEFDRKAIETAGVPVSTPVTRNLSGVSLRSALRLMLKELDLTYVIKNQVLLITTPEDAGSQLTTKVYPVADLVLPISSGRGANPFMLGGGMGGQGGFGGGMGGQGMGGMGMGGGNGFGNGGGGGGNGFGNNGFGL